jgi:hypothetical protein
MHRQRGFVLLAMLAAAAATPALGQDPTQSAAPIPDFSRMWANSLGPGFSPPASGPGPVLNKARRRAVVDIYGQPLSGPNAPIVSAGGRRIGDYTNPILQPWAAKVVKKHAEIELNAGPAPNPINQCRPSGVCSLKSRSAPRPPPCPSQLSALRNHRGSEAEIGKTETETGA